MRKFALITVLFLFSMVLFAGPAFGGMKFGVRQYSFHNSMLPSEQSLGGYFGLSSGGSLDLIFGLDYWNYKLSTDISLGEESSKSEVSGGTTQLHGGVKFYLREQMKSEVSPYIIGEIFYGLGSAKVEAGDFTADVDPIKDLLSPYGIIAGFGAEFFAADNFSVGGEIGVRYAITKINGDAGVTDLLGDIQLSKVAASQASDEPETKFTSMTIYTGITVNFAF